MEIIFNDDVPDRVAIDEALGLAKTLSDGDSPAFIHGLLSAICDDTEGREAILHPENDEPDAQPSDDGHELVSLPVKRRMRKSKPAIPKRPRTMTSPTASISTT